MVVVMVLRGVRDELEWPFFSSATVSPFFFLLRIN